jgi:hypothetical protein
MSLYQTDRVGCIENGHQNGWTAGSNRSHNRVETEDPAERQYAENDTVRVAVRERFGYGPSMFEDTPLRVENQLGG